MDLTEAQTRAERIDRQLAQARWGTQARQIDFEVEYKVTGVGQGSGVLS